MIYDQAIGGIAKLEEELLSLKTEEELSKYLGKIKKILGGGEIDASNTPTYIEYALVNMLLTRLTLKDVPENHFTAKNFFIFIKQKYPDIPRLLVDALNKKFSDPALPKHDPESYFIDSCSEDIIPTPENYDSIITSLLADTEKGPKVEKQLGVCLLTRKGDIVYLNRTGQTLFGIKNLKQPSSLNFWEMQPFGSREHLYRQFREHIFEASESFNSSCPKDSPAPKIFKFAVYSEKKINPPKNDKKIKKIVTRYELVRNQSIFAERHKEIMTAGCSLLVAKAIRVPFRMSVEFVQKLDGSDTPIAKNCRDTHRLISDPNDTKYHFPPLNPNNTPFISQMSAQEEDQKHHLEKDLILMIVRKSAGSTPLSFIQKDKIPKHFREYFKLLRD